MGISIRNAGAQQTFRELQRVFRPVRSRPRVLNAGASRLQPAREHRLAPAVGDRFDPVNSSQEGSADCGIGVGIAALHDRVDDRPFDTWSVGELIQRAFA